MQGLKLLHGGDYNPEQWLDRPDILAQDIELMKKARVNTVTLGVFSWSALEPQEGVYTRDWLADIIHNLYANGIRTILATPSAARPAWLAHKYPEVRRVRADRMLYFQWRASRGAEEKFHGAVVGHDGRQDARAFTETVQVGENWKNCLNLPRYSAKNKR